MVKVYLRFVKIFLEPMLKEWLFVGVITSHMGEIQKAEQW